MSTAWSDFFLGWSPATWTTDKNEAHNRYVGHLTDMQNNQGWPASLVSVLVGKADRVRASVDTGDDYWAQIYANEINWIKAHMNPNQLSNLPSHVAFLESVANASGSWADILDEYSLSNVLKETAPTPEKFWQSSVPYYIGGLVVLGLAWNFSKK